MARASHAQALLGERVHERVRTCKLLVVGAGGIGCELRESIGTRRERTLMSRVTVKNLVLVGFGNIEIVSLYTFML